MMKRRRFLAISAAALATPARAQTTLWRGYAMGAEVSLTLDADPATAAPALAQLQRILGQCEDLFSLYRSSSTISRLNRAGYLVEPAPDFLRLLEACDEAFRVTEGRFDPTVQPLWSAEANAQLAVRARQLIGWDRVRFSSDQITLGPGQALTLNGIAQGYATDQVARALRKSGWSKVLVNIGEYYAAGRYWMLGLSDPDHGIVDTLALKNRAVATSSPNALRLRSGQPHILNPKGNQEPQWSTVSVQAADATSADALSTALCHATAAEIEDMLARAQGNPTASCVSWDGTLTTFPRYMK
ncbi:FAD:protein FMN transferase [Ruegeria hyattellae]|uniref:FAD:protein FMN transferase n=1 Tax=Ruegeria hyattellae TaxID=3233337 RepID=UPI00355BE319